MQATWMWGPRKVIRDRRRVSVENRGLALWKKLELRETNGLWETSDCGGCGILGPWCRKFKVSYLSPPYYSSLGKRWLCTVGLCRGSLGKVSRRTGETVKQGQQLGEMSQEGKFGTSGNQNTSSSEILKQHRGPGLPTACGVRAWIIFFGGIKGNLTPGGWKS